MLFRSEELEAQAIRLQKELQNAPPGRINILRDKNRYKWYHNNQGINSYIPKSNQQFAEQLAHKKYLTELLHEALHEKMAVDLYLKHHSTNIPISQQLLTEKPEYQQLLAASFRTFSQELQEWCDEPYLHNTNYPEHLIHKASEGKLVRSKSEVMIDMVLYRNNIPFRYECGLTLGDKLIFPDFTIKHPATGKQYYWEHFGKMDDSDYCANAIDKLKLYSSNGIIPSIQLITTYETLEHPLSLCDIEEIVNHYFLH